MNWENFYFVCFLVGFALSFLSFVLGSFDFHVHFHAHADALHLPHFHVHAGDGGGQAAAHAGHAAGHAAAPTHGLTTGEPELSWFNFGSITAFLAWFGGTGYLLTRFSRMWVWFSFVIAMLAGLAGGAIMFLFVAKVLMKHDKALDPMDYRMVGVLGTLSVPIREGGTGEIVFSQEGVRRCAGARADAGEAIAKGTEVVVTRYDKGIAYVRRWDDLANEDSSPMDEPSTKEA